MKAFLPFLLYFSLAAEMVCRPVVNVYLQAKEDTRIDSQAIYGSSVKILEFPSCGWLKLRLPDGVIGWVQSSDVVQDQGGKRRPVKNLFAHIYREPDVESFPPLLTLPYGAKVKIVDDRKSRWIEVELLDRRRAWIQRGDLDFYPRMKSMEEMLKFSQKFLNLPYTWGGSSSYGFDCSGFIQMLYREIGIFLPRDSCDQAMSDQLVGVEKKDLQPGDLVFFGREKVNHVGLYLGGERFIHSGTMESPILQITRLDSEGYHFWGGRRAKAFFIKRCGERG